MTYFPDVPKKGDWRCLARPDCHFGEGCCPHAEVFDGTSWHHDRRKAQWGTYRRGTDVQCILGLVTEITDLKRQKEFAND